MDTSIIIALIALLGTIINVGVTLKKNTAETKHTEATTADTLVDTSMTLLGKLQLRVEELERVQLAQGIEIAKLRRGAGILINQIRKLGHEPEWTLDSDNKELP